MTPKQLAGYVTTHLSSGSYSFPVTVTASNFVRTKSLSEDEINVFVRPQSFFGEPSGRSSLKYERGLSIAVSQKAVPDGSGGYEDTAVDTFMEVVEALAVQATKTPEASFLSMEVAEYLDPSELVEGNFLTEINIQFQQV